MSALYILIINILYRGVLEVSNQKMLILCSHTLVS